MDVTACYIMLMLCVVCMEFLLLFASPLYEQ
jgi:hypothetical protein